MTAKNFVNFHILISHSPSCLNRDDMNMQKTAVFGGRTRVRISSQSLKRAMRTSDYYRCHLGIPSFRTRNLERAKSTLIEDLRDEFDEELIRDAATRFVSEQQETADEDSDGESEVDDTASDTKKRPVAPWVVSEIREICRAIRDVREEGLSDKEQDTALKKVGTMVGTGKNKHKLNEADCLKAALDKKIAKRLDAQLRMLRAAIGSAVDVALAGRMATSGIMRPVDGALAVAHALTTHAVEPQDVDWFTAVDDLIEEAGETGAGHLNTQQFSAGVFYRYASLNLKQLQVNLGLLAGMHSAETPESRTRALAIARHVLHMLATVVPTAKQQSHAAHNPTELAIVSFADLPVSLANASERPVERAREGGYLGPSMLSIADYWQRLDTAYGLDERAAAFCFDDTPWQDEARREKGRRWPEKLPRYLQLGELERWIENDGQP